MLVPDDPMMRNLRMLTSMAHRLAEALRWVLYVLGFLLCLGASACWGIQWGAWTTKERLDDD